MLHGGRRHFTLQLIEKRGDAEGVHVGELGDPGGVAPGREAARGVEIRLVRVVVVDLRGEKLQEALGGGRRGREPRWNLMQGG